MCFSTPSVPAAPAPLPTASEQDRAVTASMDEERRRKARASGLASMMLTGAQGAGTVNAPGKTLLGS